MTANGYKVYGGADKDVMKLYYGTGFPGGVSGEEPACQCRRRKGCLNRRLNPWVGKIPWSGAWQPTPLVLPGESHRERSLASYSLIGSHRVGHD